MCKNQVLNSICKMWSVTRCLKHLQNTHHVRRANGAALALDDWRLSVVAGPLTQKEGETERDHLIPWWMGQRRGELYTGYTMRLSYYFKILTILKITITWQDFCISEKMTFATLKRWHTTTASYYDCDYTIALYRLEMCWFVSSLDHWRKEKIWCEILNRNNWQ